MDNREQGAGIRPSLAALLKSEIAFLSGMQWPFCAMLSGNRLFIEFRGRYL
jgi:hypothetical protein